MSSASPHRAALASPCSERDPGRTLRVAAPGRRDDPGVGRLPLALVDPVAGPGPSRGLHRIRLPCFLAPETPSRATVTADGRVRRSRAPHRSEAGEYLLQPVDEVVRHGDEVVRHGDRGARGIEATVDQS